MKVLFLGLAVSSLERPQNLYSDLVCEFHRRGDHITLIAPTFSSTGEGFLTENGIPVIRVKTMKLFGPGIIMKGIANILLPWQYKRALKKSKIPLDFDLVIMPTPPITLISLANWLKKKHKASVYLILRDIFPQNAIDLKLMRQNSIVHRYFRKKEKNTYKVANTIGCMSQGNIDYVIRHNPEFDPSKFHLLPNWGPLRPHIDKNEITRIKEEYGIQGKFVAIYGGNIGMPQKVENIVSLAEACTDIKDIFFLIIGDGTERARLEKFITDKQLSNIRFISQKLSAANYFNVLQAADVGLISLSEEFTIPNIPSKALAYYNAKKPVLASLDRNTDFNVILDKAQAGLWAEAGDTEALKEKLLYLYENKAACEKMGLNGYDFFRENLLTSHAYETIIRAFADKK